MLVCVVLCMFAHETAGAARTRRSLRPLISEGGSEQQNSGELSREIAELCLRRFAADVILAVVPAFAGRHVGQYAPFTNPSQTSQTPPHNPDASATAPGGSR